MEGSIVWLLLLGPEVLAPIASVTPTSLFGWAAFVCGTGAFTILLWDRITNRGKSLSTLQNSINNLCEKIDGLETTQSVMDTHLSSLSDAVRGLTYEWRGVDGSNGAKNTLKDHEKRLGLIEKRHGGIDAVAEHERQQESRPERRQSTRRESDRREEEKP